jgi:hypothetical protein
MQLHKQSSPPAPGQPPGSNHFEELGRMTATSRKGGCFEVWSQLVIEWVVDNGGDAQGSTLDARVSTLDTRVSTLDARCSILDARHSTLNAQRSTLDAGRSTLDARRST